MTGNGEVGDGFDLPPMFLVVYPHMDQEKSNVSFTFQVLDETQIFEFVEMRKEYFEMSKRKEGSGNE